VIHRLTGSSVLSYRYEVDDDDDDDGDDELHTPSRQWDIYVRSCAVCTRYVCAVLFCLIKCNRCSQLSDVHSGQQESLLSPQWWSTSCYWHTSCTIERDVSAATNSGSYTLSTVDDDVSHPDYDDDDGGDSWYSSAHCVRLELWFCQVYIPCDVLVSVYEPQ